MKIQILNAGKTAEIILYDEIGESVFGGISAKQLRDELSAIGNVDEISLRINSEGGDVFQANAMFNALNTHPATKTVHIDGMALSAASYVAMVGSTINMAENAWMMIHDPFVVTAGTAADHRRRAELLESVEGQIRQLYVDRTGNTAETVADMMSAETWMDATTAIENGFADAVTGSVAVAASFDLSKFRSVPERLKNPPAPLPSAESLDARLAAIKARLI